MTNHFLLSNSTDGRQHDQHLAHMSAVVAERLRRLTRNQIPSGSAGSNPTGCEFFLAPDKDPLNVPSLCIPL